MSNLKSESSTNPAQNNKNNEMITPDNAKRILSNLLDKVEVLLDEVSHSPQELTNDLSELTDDLLHLKDNLKERLRLFSGSMNDLQEFKEFLSFKEKKYLFLKKTFEDSKGTAKDNIDTTIMTGGTEQILNKEVADLWDSLKRTKRKPTIPPLPLHKIIEGKNEQAEKDNSSEEPMPRTVRRYKSPRSSEEYIPVSHHSEDTLQKVKSLQENLLLINFLGYQEKEGSVRETTVQGTEDHSPIQYDTAKQSFTIPLNHLYSDETQILLVQSILAAFEYGSEIKVYLYGTKEWGALRDAAMQAIEKLVEDLQSHQGECEQYPHQIEFLKKIKGLEDFCSKITLVDLSNHNKETMVHCWDDLKEEERVKRNILPSKEPKENPVFASAAKTTIVPTQDEIDLLHKDLGTSETAEEIILPEEETIDIPTSKLSLEELPTLSSESLELQGLKLPLTSTISESVKPPLTAELGTFSEDDTDLSELFDNARDLSNKLREIMSNQEKEAKFGNLEVKPGDKWAQIATALPNDENKKDDENQALLSTAKALQKALKNLNLALDGNKDPIEEAEPTATTSLSKK